MSPEKAAMQVAHLLMVVFKEAAVTEPTESEMLAAHGNHRAPSGQSYLLKAASYEALTRAAAKLAALTDGYPANTCIGHLKDIAVAEKDVGATPAEAYERMRIKLLEFLQGFQHQGLWEAVFAVRGIDPNQGPFRIGPCSFYLMDDEQFVLWGRRSASGRYDPPADALFAASWFNEEAPMRGQFVAAARVRAINHEQARTKGRHRVEEAINLLRYGQLVVGFPESGFPEVGFWLRQWQHHHSFVVQVDRPNFGTHRLLGGPEGNWYDASNKAPGWANLEHIITLDRSDRSEMELRSTTALEWVGQAALARSTSIRLVAVVTALEALLMGADESAGKKTKLAKRISGLVAGTEEERGDLMEEEEQLYRDRSECVHGGEIEIENAKVVKAVRLLARTVEAILTKPPYSAAVTLREILDNVDPRSSTADHDRVRWVRENAYQRWLDEGKPTDRQLQHWFDAEREYVCNLVLKGRPLNSIVSKPTADETGADH